MMYKPNFYRMKWGLSIKKKEKIDRSRKDIKAESSSVVKIKSSFLVSL